ncbi:efflux RND transporter periplasmic adaptor subunit [soil metagenome]
MRNFVVLGLIATLAGTGVAGCSGDNAPAAESGGGTGRGGGRGARPPMPVEFASVKRGTVAARVTIVGNLIGAATVEAVPRVTGRLQAVHVKLGESVRRGQAIAKVEDREIQEQVRQAEAAFKVSAATIRQREADLNLARTNLERNRTLVERELLPRQTFDDTEARYQAALAQLDLARAQFEQSKSRLDELKISLANTVIASPVDGFVGKRYLDPGASVGPNVPVASIVDIRTVRMVANIVERDVKRLTIGMPAQVEVDAFPGEKFQGRVARLAPVFDPQTRTAEMEIEVPNSGYRLKPGMYARVDLTLESRDNALTVPSSAVVDVQGTAGVFVASGDTPQPASNPPAQPATLTAKFQPVQIGIRDAEQVEITSGLSDGTRVITTGATALRDGDPIVAAKPGQFGAAPARPQGGRP